ncbi:MAG: helix-turn-helix domain-containing protein [Proteocatella sp.]
MLGERIRNARKAKGFKLGDLAEITELSSSYISQLERGLIEPSLTSLRKISNALNIPIYLLMDDVAKENPIVKKDERVKMFFPNSSVSYELMTSVENGEKNGAKMLVAKFSLRPRTSESEGYSIHEAEEILVLVKGELEVTLGQDIYDLKPGDTIYILGNIPHKITNVGESFAEGYYIVSPPQIKNF